MDLKDSEAHTHSPCDLHLWKLEHEYITMIFQTKYMYNCTSIIGSKYCCLIFVKWPSKTNCIVVCCCMFIHTAYDLLWSYFTKILHNVGVMTDENMIPFDFNHFTSAFAELWDFVCKIKVFFFIWLTISLVCFDNFYKTSGVVNICCLSIMKIFPLCYVSLLIT